MGNKDSSKSWLVSASVTLVLLATGCTSPNMQKVPPQPITAYPFQAKQLGLAMGVDPYVESSRLKTHFGVNLLKHNVLPVRVMFRNSSTQGAFLLQPTSAKLRVRTSEQRTSDHPVVGRVSSSTNAAATYGRASPYIMLASPLVHLASLPFGLALEDSVADWQNISRHMESVGFVDRPLYPNNTNSGFLYFQLPEKISLAEIESIEFQIKNMLSREMSSVIVQMTK